MKQGVFAAGRPCAIEYLRGSLKYDGRCCTKYFNRAVSSYFNSPQIPEYSQAFTS